MPDTVPFDPVAAARRILREARTGGLATLLPDGSPFASLVTVATDAIGAPVLLLSGLAVHTANLAADPRASLLLEGQTVGDPLQGGRISVNGTFHRLPRADDSAVRQRFLARQPEAGLYAGFKDFDFWLLRPDSAHLVAGFGRIVKISAADLLIDTDAAAVIAADEDRLVADLRLTDLPEAIQTADGGGWRVVGLDAAGLDLGRDGPGGLQLRRICFSRSLHSAAELSSQLTEIATKPIER